MSESPRAAATTARARSLGSASCSTNPTAPMRAAPRTRSSSRLVDEEHDRGVGIDRAQVRGQLHAVDVRQVEVGEHDVRAKRARTPRRPGRRRPPPRRPGCPVRGCSAAERGPHARPGSRARRARASARPSTRPALPASTAPPRGCGCPTAASTRPAGCHRGAGLEPRAPAGRRPCPAGPRSPVSAATSKPQPSSSMMAVVVSLPYTRPTRTWWASACSTTLVSDSWTMRKSWCAVSAAAPAVRR